MRLTTPAEFDRCLERPPLYRNGPFALHLHWTDPTSQSTPTWRLGLVIPKRFEVSAVARNTIKRRWRDAFRRGRAAWAGEFGPADLVVRLQSPLIPRPPKPVGRAKRDSAPPVAAIPARVRARDRFDATAMLQAFVERVRSRGGRHAAVAMKRS